MLLRTDDNQVRDSIVILAVIAVMNMIPGLSRPSLALRNGKVMDIDMKIALWAS